MNGKTPNNLVETKDHFHFCMNNLAIMIVAVNIMAPVAILIIRSVT